MTQKSIKDLSTLELRELHPLMHGMPDQRTIEAELIERAIKGGPGSGHWGHAGGKGPGRGGSRPASEALSLRRGRYRRRNQILARATGQGFFSGDPDKTSMAKMYRESPPDVRRVADETGILALDRETFDYVLRRERYLTDLKYKTIESMPGKDYVRRELSKTTERSPAPYEVQQVAKMGREKRVTGFSAEESAVLDKLEKSMMQAEDQYYRRKISYRELNRARDKAVQDLDVKERAIVGELHFKHVMAQATHRAVEDSTSKVLDWRSHPIDMSKIELSPDFDLRRFALSTRRAVEPSTKGPVKPSSMVALSAMTGAQKKEYTSAVYKDWAPNHRSFKAKVNGVFQIHGQTTVRKKYQAAVDDRDNVDQFAFHGTHYSAAKSIGSRGFKVPKAAKAGRMLGDGVYLAPVASKSVQYVGTNFGRGKSSGVLLVSRAAKGYERRWNGSAGQARATRGFDTLYARTGTSIYGGVNRLQNDEFVVRDPTAVLPDVWIDVTRTR